MKNKSMFLKATFLILLISVITISTRTQPAYAQTATIHVDPAINTAEPGGQVFVSVTITGVEAPGVNLWQVTLKYDPSMLVIDDPLNDISEGNFLSDFGTTTFQRSVSSLGTSVYCYAGQGVAATGDGVLFSILFRVNKPGLTNLSISTGTDTLLQDPNGGVISFDVTNGVFYTDTPKADFLIDYQDMALRRPVVGQTITFNATRDEASLRGSFDPDGEITTYAWDFGDGTTQAFVKDINLTSVTTHFYTARGNYNMLLTVTDNATSPLSDSMAVVIVIDQRDIAITNIKITPSVVLPGTIVNINVTVTNLGNVAEYFNVTLYYDDTLIYYNKMYSTDVNGIRPAFCLGIEPLPGFPGMKRPAILPGTSFVVPYKWNTTDMPEARYTIRANASLVKELQWQTFFVGAESDYTNNEKNGTALITLNPINVAVTGITVSPQAIAVGHQPVSINVAIQNQGDAAEVISVSVFWNSTNLIENRTDLSLDPFSSNVFTFEWNTASLLKGPYTIQANVSFIPNEMNLDDNAMTYSGHVVISDAPVASFTYTPSVPIVGSNVLFDASQSHDPDGTIQKYFWDFGDGTNTTASAPSHVYSVAKNYNVTLIVTDNAPLNGTVQIQITIDKALSTVSISTSAATTTYGTSINIKGLVSPGRSQVDVIVSFRIQGSTSWTSLQSVKTNGTGYYSLSWTPPAAKVYQLRSVWAGDSNTYANESITAVVTVNKVTSRVSITASPQIVTAGGTISLTGALTPTRSGVTVTIQTRPEGATETTTGTATTDSSGSYSFNWITQDKGTYEVRALWSGDDNTLNGTSGWQTVTVKEAANDVPWTYYLIGGIVIVAVVAIALVYFLRMRKK